MNSVPTADRLAALKAVEKKLVNFDRGPFRDILRDLIGAAPTAEALAAFAARYPDKWAQAVTMFAGLAGFEKGLVSLNVFNVGQMSDIALLAELDRGDQALAKLGLKRAPVLIEQPPQEGAVLAEAVPNILGDKGDNAQDIRREAPGPAAPSAVERTVGGEIVDPAGSC